MVHKKGHDRRQTVLFPRAVEDYISAGNPVRLLEGFVDALDLAKLGFKHARIRSTGRPPYDPADLLKLYLYGYLNRYRSSRHLESESKRNVELMWLMRELAPDHHTIADFRKDNPTPLKEVFREFNKLWKKLGLFGGEVVGIDGSKFRAVNSKTRNFNEKKLKKEMEKLDKSLERFLALLDKNDANESAEREYTREEIEKKLSEIKKQKESLEGLQSMLEKSGAGQISLIDPDSREMKERQGTNIDYNVQIAVDSKHKLIVDFEVTNEPTDSNQLSGMAIRAKEFLGVETLEVVADRGYADGIEIKKCLDSGIIPYVPEPRRPVFTKDGVPTREFYRDRFTYDREKDVYICPGGCELSYRRNHKNGEKTDKVYMGKDCATCPLRPKCTTSAEGRYIYRWEHEEIMEDMRKRLRQNKEAMKTRKKLVEHPFGTIKRGFHQGFMLLKGLVKVGGEASLTHTSYNIKRAINILGIPKILAAIKGGLAPNTTACPA